MKENWLEILLNKLIEKGWKPRWLKHKIFSVQRTPDDMIYFDWWFWLERCYDFRRLTSKESGLWQFVCENNLIQTEHWCFIDNWERAKNVFYKIDTYDEEWDVIQTWDMEWDKFIWINEYEYRLIESALCDEDKLEKFLLENIKIS